MRIRNRLVSFAAVGAAAALVLSACASDGEEGEPPSTGFEDCVDDPNNCNSGERQEGGEITWALDFPPDGNFPWSATGGSVYTLQAIQGILPYTGQFQPDGTYEFNMDLLAAEPQRIEGPPVQTTWQIRPEAVWDDGTPITANDFIFTWQGSTDPARGLCSEKCQPRSFDENIENIEATSADGKSFTITYRDGVQAPEWAQEFTAHGIVGGIAPSHLCEEQGFDPATPEGVGDCFEYLDTTPPVGWSGGPYMIESFDIDSQVVKVPNPNWYGAEQPTLDRIVIRFLPESETWVPAIQNNELHGLSPAGFSEDTIRELQGLSNVRLYLHSGPSWDHLDLNLENEWLQDRELRRAIFTVVNPAEIAERNFGALFPDYTLRTNHVFPSSSEFHEDKLTGTGYASGDADAARAILEAAGYTGFEEGGTLTLDGEQVGPLRLRSTNAPARVNSLNLLQSMMAEIGLEVNIELTDDLGGTLDNGDYDIIQFGWSGSPLFANTGQQYWDSDSASNFGNYSNPEVDALIDQEINAATPQESADLHNQMMDLVVADAYVLPLYDTPVYIAVTDNYVNVRDNANTSLRGVYETHEWGIAAE
jgi:peptide/nickel transport system substrate-binding protein